MPRKHCVRRSGRSAGPILGTGAFAGIAGFENQAGASACMRIEAVLWGNGDAFSGHSGTAKDGRLTAVATTVDGVSIAT